jgi:hypothetical protein
LGDRFGPLEQFALGTTVLPKFKRNRKRINIEPAPPCELVTRAMKLAVMYPADRDRELVAYAASECARLGEGEMMGIRRQAAAHQARLPHHKLPVPFIAQANRFAQGTHWTSACSLRGGSRSLLATGGIVLAESLPLVRDGTRGVVGLAWDETARLHPRGRTWPARIPAVTDFAESRLKPLLDNFGICGCQRVLGREIPMRPGGRLVLRLYGRHLLYQALAKACR